MPRASQPLLVRFVRVCDACACRACLPPAALCVGTFRAAAAAAGAAAPLTCSPSSSTGRRCRHALDRIHVRAAHPNTIFEQTPHPLRRSSCLEPSHAASMLAAPRRTLRWHRRLPRAKPPRRPAGMRDEAWAAVPPNGSRRADWLAARGGVAAPSGPVGCWLMRDRGVPAALWEWELAAVRHGHCLPAATPRPS